ncbi:hypothetical protein CSPX01_00657 [Colletotrichum filicis]|nr:hypothetical protein CSPX01_00657 [Colletotrichum filicis]
MSARFQKAWKIRSIKELHRELGYTSNRGRAKFKTVLTDFRDKALSAKGLNFEDFTTWHLPEHQEELHSMAGVFLDKHAEQLWPCDENPSQSNRLRYPKDQNEIQDLVFKILCRQSYGAEKTSKLRDKRTKNMEYYEDLQDEDYSHRSPDALGRTVEDCPSRIEREHFETIYVAATSTKATSHQPGQKDLIQKPMKRRAMTALDSACTGRRRPRLTTHLGCGLFSDNRTNIDYEQESIVVNESSIRSSSAQMGGHDETASDARPTNTETRSPTNSTFVVEAGSSEDRESLSGLGAEEQTDQGQLPARDVSTNFVHTNEGLAETGSTRETAGTSLPESTAAEQAGTRHDPMLPASHGSNLGVEGTPALSDVSNINQHVPEVEFSYGVAIQYPVHFRIPWTPRGHLAFKTLSGLEIELRTVLEEGLTRTTGKQDFAGLKEFRIESWHFDVRGHGAILEFDVKRGREKQFEHMKRKVDEHMRLAIQMSPELRPSFDIEIHIVTGRDSGTRQAGGRSFA